MYVWDEQKYEIHQSYIIEMQSLQEVMDILCNEANVSPR
jgi:hypothetical protein